MSLYCSKCGNEIADNATICPKCGTNVAGKGESKSVQPAFAGVPAARAAKKGLSKGAKIGIICAASAIVIGVVVWLLIAIIGGGNMESPIKDQIEAYEDGDYKQFTESMTSGGPYDTISAAYIPAQTNFEMHRNSLVSTYGEGFKITYKITEDSIPKSTTYMALVDEVHDIKCEFTIEGPKKTATKKKSFRCVKSGGHWCLSENLF